MRLIDADALLDKQESLYMKGNVLFHGVTACAVENAPTIGPEELPIVQELRTQVKGLQEQLDDLDFWGRHIKQVLKSAAEDRAAVNVMRKHCEKIIAELRAELVKVTAERNAAVSDLEEVMAYGSRSKDACQYCGNKSCYARNGGKPCYPKWRGSQEEATNG